MYGLKEAAILAYEQLRAHLALGKKYSLIIGWTGTSYLGLTIDWHHDNGFVNISMPHKTARRSEERRAVL